MAKKKHIDNEIINELAAVVTPEETLVVEEVAVVEEPVVIEAPVAAPAPKAEKKAETLVPGEYYQGKKIERYVSNLGKKAVAIIDGKRVKVLKADVVKVK